MDLVCSNNHPSVPHTRDCYGIQSRQVPQSPRVVPIWKKEAWWRPPALHREEANLSQKDLKTEHPEHDGTEEEKHDAHSVKH
jgi:hypothetical protein